VQPLLGVDEAPAGSPWPRRLGRIALAALAVTLVLLLLQRLDLRRVLATLARADARLIALAVVLHMTINMWARVHRWRVLLEPLPRRGEGANVGELASLLFASYAASNLLPARAGEALRTVQLHRRHDYPVGGLVAGQLMEKVVEGVSLGLLAPGVVLWAHPPVALLVPLAGLAAVSLGGVVAMLFVARSTHAPAEAVDGATLGARVRRFARRLAEGMRLVHAPRVWSRALAWSWLSDFADVATIGLSLAAVGIHVPVASWFVLYLTINLAIAVPSTPGQVGVLEAAAVLTLRELGAGGSEALAFAVVYHAVHVLPTTLVGLWTLRGLGWRRAAQEA
jgi:uncharacterized protein (TIRG00374 family)